MLRDYFDNEIRFNFDQLLDRDDDLRTDYSQLNYVDGEEGDWGIVRYYKDEELIATKIAHGGDDEEIEFTQFGKYLLNARLIIALNSVLPK